MGPGTALILVVVVTTSVWVFFDARHIGARKGLLRGFFNMGPVGWTLACLLFWAICFPLYLVNRPKIIKAAARARGGPAPGAVRGGPLLAYQGPPPRPCPTCGPKAPLMKVNEAGLGFVCQSCSGQHSFSG